jgi:hypothetical protein
MMKLKTNSWIYEQYDLKKLNDTDLEKFWRIIQETWSFFFWEYTKCINCWEIKSKKDIYENFTSEYSDFTVEELENKFTHDFICTQEWCWCKTERIWWESYMEELEKSLTQNIHANLVTYKNKTNEIVGLWYSYINTLREIYNQDLHFDFSIENFTKGLFKNKMNDLHIIPTWLSIIEREKSFHTVMTTGKFMLISYSQLYDSLPWILASNKWSGTDRSYRKNGAIETNIVNPDNNKIHLLTHEKMILSYKQKFSSILI